MTENEPSEQREGMTPEKVKGNNCLWGCIAGLIVIVLLLLGLRVEYVQNRAIASSMSRAKGTLRSIGSAQLAYQAGNEKHVYGSFQALQDHGDISDDYTPDDMVDFYTLTWEVNNISTVPTEAFLTGVMSSFTIIAYPTDMSIGTLATFAITEDQVVRVYDPRNSEVDAVRTWDPIL